MKSNSRMFHAGKQYYSPMQLFAMQLSCQTKPKVFVGTPKHSQSSHCPHVDPLMAPPCPSQFSAKVSHLLSHSYRVTVVYLAPCGRKCLVSLMASSKDPSIYSACSRPGSSFVCSVGLSVESEWTSQNVHAVKFNMYGKIQH